MSLTCLRLLLPREAPAVPELLNIDGQYFSIVYYIVSLRLELSLVKLFFVLPLA